MWTAWSSVPPPVAAIWLLRVTVPAAVVNDWPTVGCAGRAEDVPSTVNTGLMRFALAVDVPELQVDATWLATRPIECPPPDIWALTEVTREYAATVLAVSSVRPVLSSPAMSTLRWNTRAGPVERARPCGAAVVSPAGAEA